MIQIDEKFDEARIRKFAAGVEHIPPRLLNLLRESLLLEQGPEYYHGQLAAFQYAHQLAVIAKAPHAQTLGCIMSVIAEHIVNKGWW